MGWKNLTTTLLYTPIQKIRYQCCLLVLLKVESGWADLDNLNHEMFLEVHTRFFTAIKYAKLGIFMPNNTQWLPILTCFPTKNSRNIKFCFKCMWCCVSLWQQVHVGAIPSLCSFPFICTYFTYEKIVAIGVICLHNSGRLLFLWMQLCGIEQRNPWTALNKPLGKICPIQLDFFAVETNYFFLRVCE